MDFTGAVTALGSSINGTQHLNGRLKQFTFSKEVLSNEEIALMYASERASTGTSVSLNYDALGRLKDKSVNPQNVSFKTTYEYEAGIKTNSTTNKVSIMSNNGEKIGYTYDKNGNIETITYNKGEGSENEKTIRYTYNELNELIREDNQVLNKTVKYSYDVGGNILKREEFEYTREVPQTLGKTYEYKYEDTNWKDKLTSFYDGEGTKQITYDAIGNPLTYDGYTYTWENGRQLKSITKENSNISFKYNDSGIRTEKTVNGKTTKYHLLGDKVTFETDGENSIYYTYDSNDNLVSMNLNGVEYYYIRNAQGDITGLFDKTGTQVVSYTYDSWGQLISIKDKDDNDVTNVTTHVGYKNPYRYRGYRYDNETQLYYLQSRYYNPSWGRFINADGITGIEGQLLSHNIFAYCINNPIMMEDPSGFMHRFLSEDGDYTSTSLSSTIIASPITSGSVGATDNYISNTGLKPLSTNEANTILKSSGVNRASRRYLIRNIPKDMRDLKLPQKGSIKYQGSVGILTTTAYGLVLLEDWENNGNTRSRVISIGIDTLGFGAGILAGGIIGSFSVPVWVGAGLVFGAGYGIGKGTSWVKGKFQVN